MRDSRRGRMTLDVLFVDPQAALERDALLARGRHKQIPNAFPQNLLDSGGVCLIWGRSR